MSTVIRFASLATSMQNFRPEIRAFWGAKEGTRTSAIQPKVTYLKYYEHLADTLAHKMRGLCVVK
jgi:hypothetical protein